MLSSGRSDNVLCVPAHVLEPRIELLKNALITWVLYLFGERMLLLERREGELLCPCAVASVASPGPAIT